MLFKGEWLVKYTQASQANKLLYSGHIGFSNLKTMREVISVHVGQAGVQIGNACCKLADSLARPTFFDRE